jgi:hypothetical protein
LQVKKPAIDYNIHTANYRPGFSSVIELKQVFFTPLLASLVNRRRDGLILVGVGVLQTGLFLAHLPGWPCPFKALTGLPCPGCGLTTAIAELLGGDWRGAIATHAFAPVFVVAFLVMLAAVVLPEPQRRRFVDLVSRIERRSGISALLLCALLIYWGLRLFRLV